MKHKNHEMAGEILEASSSFLQEELEIIKPKMIVVMGNATAGLFDEFIRTDVLDVRAPHYARMTEARKSMYLKRFRKMKKWYDQLK